MSDESYTTISVRKGLKEDLQQIMDDNETWSDLLSKMFVHERERREKDKSRWEHLNKIQHQQSRLLVRMADEMGLEKEQIPQNLAEYESWGTYSPWGAPFSDEQITDVYSEEKEEESERERDDASTRSYVTDSDGETFNVFREADYPDGEPFKRFIVAGNGEQYTVYDEEDQDYYDQLSGDEKKLYAEMTQRVPPDVTIEEIRREPNRDDNNEGEN